MKSIFIRGLWGEGNHSEFPTAGYPGVCKELRRTLTSESKEPSPILYYSFGNDNYKFLQSKGLGPYSMSSQAILNWNDEMEEARNPEFGNRINWGISYWRHKLLCLTDALDFYDEVVWLDWDYRLVKPLPDDFWDRMREGQPLQSCLRIYRNIQCPWRVQTSRHKRVSRGTDEERTTCHGSFIYCRDLAIANKLLDYHDRYPYNSDEPTLCRWAEDQLGGWTAEHVQRYRDEGYEPYCCQAKWHAFEPEEVIFRNFGKR